MTHIIVFRQWLLEALKYIAAIDGKKYRNVTIDAIHGHIVLEYITFSNTQMARFVIPAYVDRPLKHMVEVGVNHLYNQISLSYDEYDSIVFDITETETQSEYAPNIRLMGDVNLLNVSHKWKRQHVHEIDYTWFTFHTTVSKIYNFCNHKAVKGEDEIVLLSDFYGQYISYDGYKKQICNYLDTELKEVKLTGDLLLELVKPMKRTDIVEIGTSFVEIPGPIRISNGFLSAYLSPRVDD